MRLNAEGRIVCPLCRKRRRPARGAMQSFRMQVEGGPRADRLRSFRWQMAPRLCRSCTAAVTKGIQRLLADLRLEKGQK